MSGLTLSSVLSDATLREVSLIPVFSRLGVSLGMGNATVLEVCTQQGLDPDFFLTVVNSFLDPYFRSPLALTPTYAKLTLDYLERANSYYKEVQMPNLRIHLMAFLERSSIEPGLKNHILALLNLLQSEVKALTVEDEVWLFPQLRKLMNGEAISVREWRSPYGQSDTYEEKSDPTGLLEDLMQLLIRYIKGDYNTNLLHGVIVALSAFRNDLESNERLRARLFVPMVEGARSRNV